MAIYSDILKRSDITPICELNTELDLITDFDLITKELVARLMNIVLHHFIVLILILHVLWYDIREENYYFIRKVIDRRTKI